MAHFEIEVKSLLGEETKATELKAKMCELDPACACVSTNKQLNHYFQGGDIDKLYTAVEHLFGGEEHEKFKKIAEKGSDFSVRTRQMGKSVTADRFTGSHSDDQSELAKQVDGEEVLLVVKASMDEGTSENTVKRMEFEEPVSITLEELDELVISAGYEYQAKWSREREEYSYKGANVCLDKNAGYGYLAEFEKIVDDEDSIDQVRDEIDELMSELGLEELPQDRLARMFDFYNQNWSDYYGTDKTFNIE